MGFSPLARWKFAFLAVLTSVTGVLAHGPEYISTLAGNGIAGINGDGLPPLNTALYLPQDGTFGPDGGFYFSDWNNHRIRRLRDDVIVTVAGTGELGDAQDGLAIEMKLNHPTNVAFDPQGRMVIACWHNSKVKRLDLSTGMLTNVAGTGARAYGGDDGPANAARLDLPSSVIVDPDGNIYISDQANFRLRRVDPVSGNITTMCGTGVAGYTGDDGPALQATIKSPVGQSAAPAGRLDMDAEGRIYIADTGNHVIRRIDPDGTIRTIAGTGAAGFSGDDGPATAARLNTPSDVAVAADGTIYIADTRNNRIRKVESGRITTVAGTGVAGFSGDGGLGENAKLDRPYGVAIAPNGDVVIADTHNHRLRILTEEPRQGGPGGDDEPVEIIPCTGAVGSICTYAGTGLSAFNGDGKDRTLTALYWPFDMEFTPTGRIYVLDWNSHRVRQIMPDATMRTVMGTDFVGDGPPGAADLVPPGVSGLTIDLNHPTDLQEFANGDLMVMAWHNHKIRVLDPLTGLVQVIAGGPVGFVEGVAKDARLNQPPRGTLDANGNLFFVDQRNQRVRFIRDFDTQRSAAMVSSIAGTGTPGFNGDGPALQTQFNFPTGTNPEPSGGITVSATGVVYFADSLNHRIRKFQFNYNDFTAGAIETIAGTGVAGNSGDGGPALAAQIRYPQDVELGPDGKLYFTDTDNNRVRRIDLESGNMEAVAGTGVEGYSGDGGPALAATFNRPFGIAFDYFGNLYISDTFNSRIRKVKLTTTPEGPEPILPANYSETYSEVRNCRFSLEHGGVYIRILADPSSAQLYRDNASVLPVGTVIVKEEYADDQCEPDELLRWRVMRKEAPGYDPADGDWHWQWLTTRREVVEDTKATCISCHSQPDCVARDRMCAVPGNLSEMRLVLDGLPASLLSISGTPPNDGHSHGNSINFDLYAVGADPGDGRGPFVAHYEHNTGYWARLTTGATGDLWWITDRMIDDSFYMAGENGLILRLDVPTGSFERMKTPGGKLLFGVWGTDPQNLWAVGGDLSNEDAGGAVWKFNGKEWVVDAQAAAARPGGLPTLYKVWGRDANDVYAVGRLGVAIHWNGVNWVVVPTGVTRPLFTVHGNATRVAATGGAFQGVILELEGNSFVDRTPVGAPQINGVFVGAGPAAAVGAEGTWATRGGTGWELKTPVTANGPADFHATWMDTSGGIWAVGGDLTVDQRYGVLAYAGGASVSRQFASGPCATGITGPAGTVSFHRQILPLFRASGCQDIACHGGFPLNPESEYDLRSYETFFGPGLAARNFGMCEIVPGNPDASYIMEKLMPSPRVGAQMPNELPPLSSAQLELVRTWIEEGAIDDTPLPGSFSRGDVDANGTLNITDPISIFNYLFLNGGALACIDAGDLNDDNVVNITDGIYSLNFQFLGGPRPVNPFPACGQDPTSDELPCDNTRC